MTAQALPNFFIVGAPKAGTTSLYRYLGQHPQIYMSPVKEPCYFASEFRPERFSAEYEPQIRQRSQELKAYLDGAMSERPDGGLIADWEDYLKLFKNVRDERAIGESSVSYLWSETAARSIRDKIPNAKIVMILRDPAERAFSQHLHNIADGLVRHSFREHIQQCLRPHGEIFSVLYPFLENGLYYEQVKRYLDLFPANQVRVYIYEEEWREPARLLADLTGFLGIDKSFQHDTSSKELERRAPRSVTGAYLLKKTGLWQGAKTLLPPALRNLMKKLAFKRGNALKLDPADRALLIDYYRQDVEKLVTLLNRDLSVWLR